MTGASHFRRAHIRPARMGSTRAGAATLVAIAIAAVPAPARALNPIKPICGVAGWVSGVAGKACGVVQHAGRLVQAGGKLVNGHLGSAAKTLLGSGAAPRPSSVIALAAIGAWVMVGAKAALHETARAIVATTSPRLGTTWFSSTYWRMTGLAAILTMPFLFAAAVQAVLRSDLALLGRAALGYLPLATLAVSVAAPLTMLLLAASDQMSAVVSSAGGSGGVRFLQQAGLEVGTLSALDGSPFLAFLVGLLTAVGAVVLWLELLMRQAAIYVVVLMLPLAFAALVWPARRVWALRAVELLVALILAKFAIVAVLSLAGAALGQRGNAGVGGMLTGMVLVALASFAPWALIRLLPLAELASGAAGSMRGELSRMRAHGGGAHTAAGRVSDWASSVTAGMRDQAETAAQADPDRGDAGRPARELAKLAAASGSADEGVGAADGDLGHMTGGDLGHAANGHLGHAAGAGEGVSGGLGPAPGGGYVGPGAGSAAAGDTPSAPESASSERSPGLESIYQAADGAWRELVFDPEEVSRAKPLWPLREGADAGTVDDHDPRPDKQGPEHGSL